MLMCLYIQLMDIKVQLPRPALGVLLVISGARAWTALINFLQVQLTHQCVSLTAQL